MTNRNKISTICLMLGMFFLPFGYDALFMLIMNWTGSYWVTDGIFYCISAVFVGLYFYFSKTNPFNHFKEKAKKLKLKFEVFADWNK